MDISTILYPYPPVEPLHFSTAVRDRAHQAPDPGPLRHAAHRVQPPERRHRSMLTCKTLPCPNQVLSQAMSSQNGRAQSRLVCERCHSTAM
ncbi:hypothetical protein HaLaN_02445 [Haematococcus lacustris]|uniref:Uncharacterized protein n=1 Tax=Haematococcus lacustris TaxID=44745 RepID=A0A699YBR0_HAELA|nr:hypothetical protein HaLaN_02445 [Haematococcus lacustris]